MFILAKYEKGKIVKGAVTGIERYGIFVSLDDYYSGLIHISEISHAYVRDIHDFVNVGDTIYVEILEVDSANSHLKLSIKDIAYKPNKQVKKRKIEETGQGFQLLKNKLPIWIAQKLDLEKNNLNHIDK